MKIMFYAAYRDRGFALPQDIKSGFRTFEEAEKYAYSLLCDDDDCAVYTLLDGVWYRVFARVEGNKYRVLKFGNHLKDKEIKEIW